jgi:probable HAF family extracellular repeat protein
LEDRRLLSTIVDLGTLGGSIVDAEGINNSGQVVGESGTSDNSVHAYFYDGSTMNDLGTLPGGTYSVAHAINDSGQVVGHANVDPNDANAHAFLWDSVNGMQDLGSLGGEDTLAYAVNSFGEVVGESALPGGRVYDAFLYSNGTMYDLGNFGSTYARATGINDADQVVGFSNLPGTYIQHAFLWDSVNGMQDLGTLGGDRSNALAVNASGQVVGSAQLPNGGFDAFLWDSVNGMQDLGTLPGYFSSVGLAINSSGQVVGESNRGTIDHAFLSYNGTMTDLNDLLPPDSGWTLNYAYGINDAGQITGVGTYAGVSRAYLLTLDSSPGANVSKGHPGRSSGIATDPISPTELPLSMESGGSLGNTVLTSTKSPSAGPNNSVRPLSDSRPVDQFFAVSPEKDRAISQSLPEAMTSGDAGWLEVFPTHWMGDEMFATLA